MIGTGHKKKLSGESLFDISKYHFPRMMLMISVTSDMFTYLSLFTSPFIPDPELSSRLISAVAGSEFSNPGFVAYTFTR